MSLATLLISQQSLYPHAGCAWVQSARVAVRWCRDNNHTVVTSVGVPTRNLVTALCAIENTSCELVLPASRKFDTEKTFLDYGLSRQVAHITYAESPLADAKETELHGIDDLILEKAEIALVVSLRNRGYMAKCLESAEQRGKTIVRDFETPYESTSSPAGYSISPASLSDDIRQFNEPLLIHWTRTSSGPWPHESSIDYYRVVVASPKYPRTAFDTLRRILSTRTIYASSRHIAAKEAVVSFSSLPPAEVVPLMRWRARYRQMSFEPYGIGIRNSVGADLGILPVRYGMTARSDSNDVWLTQSIGAKTDWRTECEHRHRGDMNLQSIDNPRLFAFTRTEDESRIVSDRFGVQSIWFER